MYDAASIVLVGASILFASSILLLGVKNIYGQDCSRTQDFLLVFACIALSLACLDRYHPFSAFVFLGTCVILCTLIVLTWNVYRQYMPAGILFYFSNIVLGVAGAVWGLEFLLSLHTSTPTRILLVLTLPLLFLNLPFGFLRMVEQFDVLCRAEWRRPREPLLTRSRNKEPMVSLHVPTYAEPPEIVIETLDKIAQLEYENYEVLVVDNNTKDPRLWKPVEAHCRTLGRRFRFFHVDPLAGAKAGALNFAITRTSARAEIVGVIDSDYHPEPNFIRDLVGYFRDPAIGFVQTPHDYRNWEHSSYLTMCYWEYKAFFHTILVALNERDAALTIGTMCLLRKKAIIDAGGWATWCLTEDSELAIRVHDIGYSSVYVPLSYGRGLIPETFGDYAKQRYRWVAGPVQEFKYHVRHLVGLAPKGSRLSMSQRVHHIHHGFGSLMFALNVPLIGLSILLAISMLVHREIIPVPFPLWISVTVLFVSNLFLQWLQYRVILKTSFREMLMGLLAHKALSHVVNVAAFNATVRGSEPWRRTNKFKSQQTVLTSLASTRTEIALGLFLCAFALALFFLDPLSGLLVMCLIGILYKGFDYLAAPLVAVISQVSGSTDSIVKGAI